MKSHSFVVRVLLGSLGVIASLMPCIASAQTTYTWTGGGADNNWGTAGNWSNGVPANSGNTVLVFSGSTRTSPNNNLGDWNLSIGRLQFASGAASFTLGGNNFGFDPYLGSQTQQIFQNSASTQTIGVGGFSFRNGADSQINLNAGDLVISSANMYIDASSSVTRQFYITGTDSTRRTVTFTGNVNKGGSGNDPDMVIQGNKRALVTGSLTFGTGNDGSVFIDDGVLQFSGAGTMTGGRPVIGAASGSGNAAVWLDTAGSTFGRQLEVRNGSSGRRTIGGLNTSGTVTFSGEFVGNASDYDLAATTGGATVFSGVRNINGGLFVNRPDGATVYGGTVILSGTTNSNNFAAVHAGTLQFSDFNQLGSSHVEFNADSGDSGTLRYAGGSVTTTRTLWIDNPGITRAAIDVSEAGTTLTWNPGGGTRNQNLTKTGPGWLFFGGGISGGTVGVEGGLLVLSASNSYSGGTVVSGGTLEASAGGGQGGSPAALGTGTVSIASGAQVKYWLSLSGSNTVSTPFSLSGGTLHTTDGFNTYSGRVTLASGSSTISAQYEDTITLSGGLAGSGNVLFTQSGGTGSWAAPTYVLTGTGANTGTVRVSGSSGGGATRLQLANVNALQSATLDMAAGDTGAVEFTVAGTNTYNLGGLQGSRNLTFGTNSLSVGGNGQSTTYSGTLTSSGSGSLVKVGAGTLTLSGTNFVFGTVAINDGVLAVASSGAFQTVPTISFGGGTLQYASNTALQDYSSRFSTAAGQQYRIDTNGYNVSFMSALTSAGGSLTKLGEGSLQLSGTNSYSGGTTVSGGVLAGTVAALQGNIVNNATVNFLGNTSGTYFGVMSGTGSLSAQLSGELVLAGANTYSGGTVVSSGSKLRGTTSAVQGAIVSNGIVEFAQPTAGTYAGVMSGTGSVVKSGAGVLQFTAANTYTGSTSVLDGGLNLNGSIAGRLNVASIASLSGTGTVGGNATIAGTHSPGNSPGAQTFNANLTYEAGAVVNWELIANSTGSAGTNYDQIIMPTGNLTFSGSTTLALSFNSPGSAVEWSNPFWDVNRSWAIYDLSGGTTTGLGNLVLGGSLLDSLGSPLSPTGRGYFTTSLAGQDVLLNFVAVPEPSTWAMALAGLTCGGWIVRRRSRQGRGRCITIAAAFVLVVVSFATVTSRAASITNVGLLPDGEYTEVRGLSSDGSVAVGSGDSSSAARAFRWTATSGTLQNLGVLSGDLASYANAVSGDGSVVVGVSSNQGVGIARAFRWTTTSGTMEDLGGVPGATWTEARAVSSNGSTVVGTSFVEVGSDMAVRWTSGTVQSLGRFPGGTRSLAEGVNADGSVVVGYANDAAGTMRAYRWTDASGTLQDLGTPPGGSDTTQTLAYGVNADGSVVVGGQGIGDELRAFRWTLASGTMQDLGLLPDGINALAFAVSSDGATVVGEAEDASGVRAFVWTPTLGMRDLNTYLPSLGVNLTDWVLETAYAVSADGNWIGGYGYYQDTYSGFVANITPVPEPSTCAMALAAIACGGVVMRRRRVRNRRSGRLQHTLSSSRGPSSGRPGHACSSFDSSVFSLDA